MRNFSSISTLKYGLIFEFEADMVTTIRIHAYHFAETFDIKKFRAEYTGDLISGTTFDFFYRYKEGYIYVLSYGVVVFGNVEELDRSNFLRFLFAYSKGNKIKHQEDFTVEQQNHLTHPVFSYSYLSVPEITPDIIRTTMLQVAQSAALDYYQEVAQQLFDETSRFTNQLEKYGDLKIRKKKLIQFIGRTLNTKNRIIDDIYVIDAPPGAWENELVGKVYDGLLKTFDIKIRFREVEYLLKNLESSLSIFIELIDSRNSHRLEWVIIVLILIEVLHMLINQVF